MFFFAFIFQQQKMSLISLIKIGENNASDLVNGRSRKVIIRGDEIVETYFNGSFFESYGRIVRAHSTTIVIPSLSVLKLDHFQKECLIRACFYRSKGMKDRWSHIAELMKGFDQDHMKSLTRFDICFYYSNGTVMWFDRYFADPEESYMNLVEFISSRSEGPFIMDTREEIVKVYCGMDNKFWFL